MQSKNQIHQNWTHPLNHFFLHLEFQGCSHHPPSHLLEDQKYHPAFPQRQQQQLPWDILSTHVRRRHLGTTLKIITIRKTNCWLSGKNDQDMTSQLSVTERFVPWRSLSKSMQSTLQSQPGQSQPSSSGGTVSIARNNRTMRIRNNCEHSKEQQNHQNNYQQDNWTLLSSFNRGGSTHNWWNPRSQAPSQRIISLSAGRSIEPHFAQNICRRIKMPE